MVQWASALGVQPAAYPAVGDALAESASALIAPLSLAAFPQKSRGPYALEDPVRRLLVSSLPPSFATHCRGAFKHAVALGMMLGHCTMQVKSLAVRRTVEP